MSVTTPTLASTRLPNISEALTLADADPTAPLAIHVYDLTAEVTRLRRAFSPLLLHAVSADLISPDDARSLIGLPTP